MTDAPVRLHADEIETNTGLVRRLLATQFPEWADLPVRVFSSAGSDNAIYRLGDALAVRLPRRPSAAGQVEQELAWLPRLAPHLPLTIPVPLALGQPGEGSPLTWGVYRWLPGEPAFRENLTDFPQAARDLAGFIRALQAMDPTGAPMADSTGGERGAPLLSRDAYTRENIARSPDDLDRVALTAAWEVALQAPVWDDAPVWIHGDLKSDNLLAEHGRLSAVIDFGALRVGDPACELAVAWNWLDAESRLVFREAVGCDEATWVRGRGWALSIAAAEIPYYLHTNPAMVARSRYALSQVLLDSPTR
ncbi:aminoglycoside phosphotransferase (APT) family kinase protein [Deinococcus sp. HSC-46F16]|uniref:aminoglycoside phosphotransferase family protein n=1 Tax=Deinococcus sp. HSC-46F16 TaxID=2910968 RepID=UPI0020A01E63|nr:aminoglycoside phosphotransferase family protein [Deinococcus sp. HSC-46F16]MCP2014108.1 aminoglycoside phosphotransferase (APT) family kinase protein [Deinococcus sp. HSC-46F16]